MSMRCASASRQAAAARSTPRKRRLFDFGRSRSQAFSGSVT
jgi:hypothetical protein